MILARHHGPRLSFEWHLSLSDWWIGLRVESYWGYRVVEVAPLPCCTFYLEFREREGRRP